MIPSGTTQPKIRSRQNVFSTRPENSTLAASSSFRSVESSMAGMRVVVKVTGPDSAPRNVLSRSPGPGAGVGSAPGFSVPRISRSVSDTFSTLPSRSKATNRLIGISIGRGATSQPWITNRTVSAMKR